MNLQLKNKSGASYQARLKLNPFVLFRFLQTPGGLHFESFLVLLRIRLSELLINQVAALDAMHSSPALTKG